MRILIDMDMVLNKFWKTCFEFYNRMYNQNVQIDRDQLNYYYIFNNIETTNKDEKLNSIFKTPEFWYNLEIFENAYDVMKELCKKHEVLIASCPWVKLEECWGLKIKWIKKHLPFFDLHNVILTTHKYYIEADILFDDDLKYLTRFKGTSIAMDYPYNREDMFVDYRVNNWVEFKELVEKL